MFINNSLQASIHHYKGKDKLVFADWLTDNNYTCDELIRQMGRNELKSGELVGDYFLQLPTNISSIYNKSNALILIDKDGNAFLTDLTDIHCIGANIQSVQMGERFKVILDKNGMVTVDASTASIMHGVKIDSPKKSISVGNFHMLTLDADGNVDGYGSSSCGQRFPPEGLKAVAISAGGWHSLALTAEGEVVCWGDNCKCPAIRDVIAISAGKYHSLALTAEGRVIAWGDNRLTHIPPAVKDIVAICAGDECSVALDVNGRAHYWDVIQSFFTVEDVFYVSCYRHRQFLTLRE